MRVLVTGGVGFIGSHLVEALRARGDDVVVLDRCDAGRAARPGVRWLVGDLRDGSALDAALDGVEAVVHLAARPGVRESFADPAGVRADNVEATARLLERLAGHRGARLVFAGSSSVYGARAAGSFGEDDVPLRPISPYGQSKLDAERLVADAARSGLAATTLRLFTVYGPGQRPEMAIARFVRLGLADQPVTVFGDGDMTRDFTYVSDAVDALVRALDRAEGHQVYNVGAGAPVTLRALVEQVSLALGRPLRVVHRPTPDGDVPRTHADSSRIGARLGWRPRVTLAEGLARYVAWVRAAA